MPQIGGKLLLFSELLLLFSSISYDHTTKSQVQWEYCFARPIYIPFLFFNQHATSTLSLMTSVPSLSNVCRFRYFPKSHGLKIILSPGRSCSTLIRRWCVRKCHTAKVYSVTEWRFKMRGDNSTVIHRLTSLNRLFVFPSTNKVSAFPPCHFCKLLSHRNKNIPSPINCCLTCWSKLYLFF